MVILKEAKSMQEAGILISTPSKPEVVSVVLVRKADTFEELVDGVAILRNRTRCGVQAIFSFDTGTWTRFKNDISMTIPQFSGYGGNINSSLLGVVKCICPKLPKDIPIYVDPEGYNYARYVGLAF